MALPFAHVMATDYYVDSVAGNDTTNNGLSSAAPWKSLTKINGTTFVAGDKVLFKRGSAWTGTLTPKGSGAAGNPLVFDAYGTGAAPIIDGAGASNTVMLWSKSYFTFQNFNITNVAVNEGYRAGIRLAFVGAAAPAGVTTFRQVKILNNEIHHVAGTSNRDGGLYDTAALYVEFQDYQGAQTYVDDLLIEGNDLHDNRCIGLYVKAPVNYSGRQDLWATNLVVRSNIFDQGGADHIVINGANGPLIEYNAGYDAGVIGSNYRYIAGMWTCYFTREALFQFNEVARTRTEYVNGEGGDSQAFDVDYGTYDTHTFQYNYTHDNTGGVLLMMPKENKTGAVDIPKTVIYRYNLSVNDARNTNSGCQFAIYPVLGVNSANIYNNVFYTNRPEGFRFKDVQASYYTNNVFYGPSGLYPNKPTFDHNAYFGHSPIVTDHNKILADPKFAGPLPLTGGADGYLLANTGMFKLQSNSPLINAGATIAGNGGLDLWGDALYSGSPDIGAHEYPGGSVPAPTAATITDNPPSAAVTYTGAGWTHSTDTLYQNSTKSVSSTVGDYAQFAFTGTNVTLVGKKGPALGKLTVQIDTGTAVTVDCYWPVDLLRAELYQVNGLSPSGHTLKATIATKNAAASGNAIGLDYFAQSAGSPVGGPLVANVDNPAGAVVVYTGTGWTHATGDTVRYAGTRSYSATIGDYVEFTFTGTGARIWGAKASTQGKLGVTIDGGPATVVNCYQPTVSDSLMCTYEINGLTAGLHTLRATIATKDAASTGNNVTVDLFQVLTGGAAYPLAPVIVDNPAGAAVAYNGAWTHSADANYYNSTKSVSNTLGNYVTFTFTGTGASLYAKKDASLGKLDVQIDGGTATSVDCYATSPAYQVKVFEVSGLPLGTHTLRATVAAKNPSSSGNFIGVDYFTYQP